MSSSAKPEVKAKVDKRDESYNGPKVVTEQQARIAAGMNGLWRGMRRSSWGRRIRSHG